MNDTSWDELVTSLGLTPSARAEHTAEERAKNAARCAEQRRRRAQRGLDPDDPRHGKATTYTNWGCRCPRCRAANTEACRDRRATA